MSALSHDDVVWLRSMFGGRTPREITRMKALVEGFQAHRPIHPSDMTLPPTAQEALLVIIDELGHLRAHFNALDMTFADLQDADARQALRTIADGIHTRLRAIREDIDDLYESDARRKPALSPA
ncbi:hypothetical protein [Saliniramus sp.]|uniref:hypothetical protein n=1 Tax=Saliniramus sp. TaxID=2986772 RepID=UPI002B8F603A|nr:hypothetical protein [Saliniramus sp.]HMB09468.1 hypothetical protein [Saliniramus sp.]